MRALIALLIAFAFASPALSAKLYLDFGKFWVKPHFTEAAASLNAWNEGMMPFALAFRNTSYEEMANQPHRYFGGQFVLVEVGCGTACQTGILVNRVTGEAVPDSKLPVAGSSYDYRFDSALLVVNPTSPLILANRENFPDQTTYYFVWTVDNGWEKLGEEEWPAAPVDEVEMIQATLFGKKEAYADLSEMKIPVPRVRPSRPCTTKLCEMFKLVD